MKNDFEKLSTVFLGVAIALFVPIILSLIAENTIKFNMFSVVLFLLIAAPVIILYVLRNRKYHTPEEISYDFDKKIGQLHQKESEIWEEIKNSTVKDAGEDSFLSLTKKIDEINNEILEIDKEYEKKIKRLQSIHKIKNIIRSILRKILCILAFAFSLYYMILFRAY